ncbi:MAG: peptidase S8 and S53 subtilisin kexin sedolisin [Actinobacteria bacterium]|nr:MAG: peptidase S8 and S53 subtilisin kexin sedolisin [Actinomycetota bacterium]
MIYDRSWGGTVALARSWGARRRQAFGTRFTALAIASLVVVATGGVARSAAAALGNLRMSVIVRTLAGDGTPAEQAVRGLGGTVGLRLGIIDGFSATIPAAALTTLQTMPGIVSVSPNTHLRPESANYDPSTDVNSMDSTTQYTGAQDFWSAGYTGAGVDVAVIDSGVAPVDGMSAAGKVVYGPDLSLESQAPNLTNLDTFGHGTFISGLIAGRDDEATAPYQSDPASMYRGMAPDARIVSIKVATADGGTDVSQVIAAIDWVVQHAHDTGMNIRVLNLSYGTNSSQSYVSDPLAYAAEAAWKSGIVVVASAGNLGFQRSHGSPALANPAFDPYIIAVGSSDSEGTQTVVDDTVSKFSAGAKWGNARAPDFVAPGAHLQGLRVPNSYIDANHPEGMIDARYFRGSGTSQSAAIVSGAVALLLSKNPSLAPDQVKKMLQNGAYKLSSFNALVQGAGELRMTPLLSMAAPNFTQSFLNATGTGLLELARGTDHLTRDGVVLRGEQDIFGHLVDDPAIALLESAGSSWSGGDWNGDTWTGSSWSGSSWSGSSWSGSSWSGSSWSGSSWSGASWSGSSWSGSSWSGSSWSGSSWSGQSWSNSSWG